MRLGRTDLMVSRLGFGGIPIQRISEEEAVAVVNRCLELGITFVDTATAYTNSEERIGKAIAARRKGIIVATKSLARTGHEIERDIQLSLKRLGVESIDLYQFHSVSDFDTYARIIAPDGPMAVVNKARRMGVVKHIGITSHSMDVAREAVRSDRFETLMFPFNFITCEAANELLPLAREHDVGFIAMKPLAGGMLDNVTIALKYLMQFPEVLMLVGVQGIHEIKEVVDVIEGTSRMTEAEQMEMRRMKEELGTRFCRRCDYCQPCKEGIPISLVMSTRSLFQRLPPENIFSGRIADDLDKAANCVKCGECEGRCPYKLPISEMLEEYSNLYREEKSKYLKQMVSG